MLYGRTAELETLTALIESARAHRSGVMVVRGDPGIGKSALLEEVAREAQGVTLLRARGVKSEAALDFAALHQLLRPALSRLHRLPPGQASALKTVFGMQSGPGGGRFLVSVGALSLMAEIAEGAPVLCLVDDAQWLDQASANALAFVARRIEAERVALVFTVRDEKHDFDDSGLAELTLSGLGVDAARDLLESLGLRPTDHVVEHLVAGTDGNPLAIQEIAAVLTREQVAGLEALPTHLPVSGRLQEAFIDRARTLPDPAQTFLLVVAADETGVVTTVGDAAARLGASTDAWEAAEAARLVDIDQVSVRLRHPLVRSAIYESASSGDRRRAHSALAATHQRAGDLERAAWHLGAATARPDEQVAATLEQAAVHARTRAALETACDALERAAALPPAPATRARRTAAAAEAAWAAGQLDRARGLIDKARTVHPTADVESDLQRLRGWIEMTAGSASSATHILRAAARDAATTDPSRSLQMAAAAAEMAWMRDHPEAVTDIRRFVVTLAVGDSLHDRYYRQLVDGLSAHASGDARDGLRQLRSATRLAEQHDDTELLHSAGHLTFYAGDDTAAMRINTTVAGRARADGAAGPLLFALERQGVAEILAGRWAHAAATFEEASSLAVSLGAAAVEPPIVAWKAYLAAVRGTDDFTDLIATSEEMVSARTLGIRGSVAHDVINWAHGIHELVDDRPAVAYQRLAAIVTPPVVAMTAFDRFEAAVRAQLGPETDEMLAWSEAFATASGMPWAHALAAYTRSSRPDTDRATHLEQALESGAKGPRPFDHARIQLALGEHLRRNRRRVDARQHLQDALTAFEALGAAPWVERATQEVRASGMTARPRNPSTALDLTPQELQVARFVADGLSNRAVAERLFLSPRTVDYHLRKIFVKLGISSRTQLSRVLLS